jgi:6-phosphofructokinase 1
MRIAVLTGGGDCPGLNGAIKWVTQSALDPLWKRGAACGLTFWASATAGRVLVELEPDRPESLPGTHVNSTKKSSALGPLRRNQSRNVPDQSVQSQKTLRPGCWRTSRLSASTSLWPWAARIRWAFCPGSTISACERWHSQDHRRRLVGTDYSLGFDSAVNTSWRNRPPATTSRVPKPDIRVKTMGHTQAGFALYGGECSGATSS